MRTRMVPAHRMGKLVAVIGGIAFVASACSLLQPPQQQSAPPVINNIITPASDGAPMALLAVAGCALVFAVGVGVWLFMRGQADRRRAEHAELTLVAASGQLPVLNGRYVLPASAVRVPGSTSLPMLDAAPERRP